MLETTNSFAETIDSSPWADVFSDTLRSLRIRGSLLLRETYAPPWGVGIPDADKLGSLLGIKAGARAVAFHLVEHGHCEIRIDDGSEAVIEAGEMAICFSGTAHRISQGPKPRIQPVETLLAAGAKPERPAALDRARGSALLCGVFLLHDTFLNPLFAALPALLHTSLFRPGEFHNLSGVARLMAQEVDRNSLGSSYIVERLLEVLCAEALRAHIGATPNKATGWLSAVKDPIVGRAIAAVHTRPGVDWSVQRLAQGVSMSPSRFAARFVAAVGESPMVYVAKWRMNVACRLLTGTKQGIAQVAADVGYDSLAAFNRAFKKHTGVPPAAWRRRERG